MTNIKVGYMEDKIINIRKAQLLSFSIAIPFLIIHTGLIFMFRYYGITPMFYFNIGSAVFYLLMQIVIAVFVLSGGILIRGHLFCCQERQQAEQGSKRHQYQTDPEAVSLTHLF